MHLQIHTYMQAKENTEFLLAKGIVGADDEAKN